MNDLHNHTKTIAELSARYKVSPLTIISWREMQGFPTGACSRATRGSQSLWDQDAIDAWLRARPRHRRQRPARWWTVLGIDGYPAGRSTTHG